MNEKQKQALFSAVTADRERLPKDWNVEVSFDIDCLLAIVAAMQLSLRHPQFKHKPSAHIIRHAIAHLIAGIPEDMTGLRELARLGNDPKYDD